MRTSNLGNPVHSPQKSGTHKNCQMFSYNIGSLTVQYSQQPKIFENNLNSLNYSK